MSTILLVDDDPAVRTVVSRALSRAGHEVEATATASGLFRLLQSGRGDVLVTDVMLPDANGIELLPQVRQARPDLPVIVISAQNTIVTAVRANDGGAFDYLPKPFDLNALTAAVGAAIEVGRTRTKPAPGPAERAEAMPIIGRSVVMQEVYRIIARVVKTELPVLVLGESGTGKELVARALHEMGPRAAGPFIAINMAAIPRELIESELFGHERGAFTGATAARAGRFELAAGGTLFLDEIGDMPIEAQTRLLRVLQSGEYTSVGGARTQRADVRIVSATNKDLGRLVDQGLFREDLYYRMNVVPITLPPLRDREDDVRELADHFLSKAAREGLPRKTLSGGAGEALRSHRWPGNVRELENLMRRLAVLAREDELGEDTVRGALRRDARTDGAVDVKAGLRPAVEAWLNLQFAQAGNDLPADGLYDRVMAEVEPALLQLALAATAGNQIRAAKLLGLNRNTLRKRLTERRISTAGAP